MKNEKFKIKVCYVTSVDTTLRFILFNHLKFLLREGYDVSAVCSDGKWVKDIEEIGIKVKTIRFKRKISPLFDIISLIRLFVYFEKERFDIVHTHTPKAGLIGQLAAKFAGVPIIINTIHGFYFQKDDSWFKRKFFILAEKIASKCSSLIFFVNKEDMKTAVDEKICRSELERYFGGGVDFERFNTGRFSKDYIAGCKEELRISQKNTIIGIVARLVKEKGYLDLFKAFKMIIKDFPKLTLLVVGSLEPEKKDAIKPSVVKRYKIQKNVKFLREITNIEEVYALMDIFVLPSYREGLGISIIEASAMGKPVIASDIRGCREVVDNGKTGILIPVKNAEKLAEAIIYLLKNPVKAIQMGKLGREKILREFDERLVFDRIKKEYEKLIVKKDI